ncbi:MAG: hypothetical protein LC127_13810 [Chitinophagales bacterium]|nr:hypothetical protein [Chitinophagales bacterium]
MNTGETLHVELTALAMKDDGSAAYGNQWSLLFRRGSTGSVVQIGSPVQTEKYDGTMNCDISVRTITNGVYLQFLGPSSHIIDWNIYLRYLKGYHGLVDPGSIPSPIDPRPPDA